MIFRAHRSPWDDRVEIAIAEKLGEGRYAVAEPLVMKAAESDVIPGPTFTIPMRELQPFLDELWSIGMRPTDYGQNKAEHTALSKHLEDMRRIAFRYLGLNEE